MQIVLERVLTGVRLDAFAQQRTSPLVKVCEKDATVTRFANRTDVSDDFVHGLEKILGTAELDACFQHFGSGLCRMICQLVDVCLCRDFLRIGAITLVRIVDAQRLTKNIEPNIKPVRMNVGMHRLLVNRAANNKVFKIQVLGNIFRIFLTGNESFVVVETDW